MMIKLIFFLIALPFIAALGWIFYHRANNRYLVTDPDTGEEIMCYSFARAMRYYRKYNFPRKVDAGGYAEPWMESAERVINHLNTTA